MKYSSGYQVDIVGNQNTADQLGQEEPATEASERVGVVC